MEAGVNPLLLLFAEAGWCTAALLFLESLLTIIRSVASNPAGASFFALTQNGPGAYIASRAISTGSFLEIKQPGRGLDHQPPSRAVVKGRMPLFPFSAFVAGYKVKITVSVFKAVIGFPYIKNKTRYKKIKDEANKNIPSGTRTSEPRSPVPYASHTARLPELVKEIEVGNNTSREY
jgi:hypothetical protein